MFQAWSNNLGTCVTDAMLKLQHSVPDGLHVWLQGMQVP